VSFLEILEQFRDLSLPKWNLKEILNDKLHALLKQHKTYWKQRGTTKWVKLGYEGTKFFHANATIEHRKNLISSLKNEDGNPIFAHHEKEDFL